MSTLSPPELPVCDISQRYVRILREHENGLVEFEFSVAWAELFVELVLPQAAFAEFCAHHRVRMLN